MNDLYVVIGLQFLLITLLFTYVIRLKQRMDTFDKWADTVDEFMDAEYVDLDIRFKP